MDADEKLDELGHDIFRLAIFKGERGDKAADLAMRDPLAKRERIYHELAESVAHELNWYADDCQLDKREHAIDSIEALLGDDRFIVMPECYEAYKRIIGRSRSRNLDRRLRSELRRHGQLLRGWGDYLSIRIPGRFVLHVQRTGDGMLEATSLTQPGQHWRRSRQRDAA